MIWSWDTPLFWVLFGVVVLAFTVESALGFGSTVVAVVLASQWVPLADFLPVFVPLNLVISTVLVARGWKKVAWGLLVRQIFPLMLLGMPLGMFLFRTLDPEPLRRAFGAFVMGLATFQLWGELRKKTAPPPAPVATGLLGLAGLIHGAFGTGGPLVVYVLGNRLDDKAAFRATLSALWWVLNVILIAGWAAEKRLTGPVWAQGGALGAGLLLGLILGERLFHKIPQRVFRRAVFGGLLVAGTSLVVR